LDLEGNVENAKYFFMSRQEYAEKNHNVNTANKIIEIVANFKYVGMTVTERYYVNEEVSSRLHSVNAC